MPRIAPTYADFIVQYPVFGTVSGPTVQAQLSISARLLDEAAWGDFYSDGVALDAAHNLTINNMVAGAVNGAMQLAGGPVTSASGAGISMSFAQPQWNSKSTADNWYFKTTYGQQFLRLRNSVVCLAAM
jgi:hypothetical protein